MQHYSIYLHRFDGDLTASECSMHAHKECPMKHASWLVLACSTIAALACSKSSRRPSSLRD